MKTFLKVFLVLVVLGIFGYTLYFLWEKSQEQPVVFETAQASELDIIKKTTATGSVKPRKEIEIKPKVSGIIEEIYVEEGQILKKGDLIARVKIIPNMVNLNNAESRVDRAKIQLTFNKTVYDRQKELYEKGVIALSEFEQAETTFQNSQEEVEAAIDNLELIRDGQTSNSNSNTNTLIRSTIEGMLLEIPVEEGNSVIESNTFNDGTTIATVADMGEMIFEGKIDESEVGKIKEGMPLILTIGAIEDVEFEAILEHISPKGVEENGAVQFEIRAQVTLREDYFIRAGYSANAAIVLDRRDQVLAISESLLSFENDTIFVEVETSPQVFEKRIIKTGLSDGINIEILNGLTKEENIKRLN
ncbi:efflux RND transporter periplasmic adaptor subunit [Lentimicrobium sp. L6]|uniref:efflux RND transporter periplasmic adaptor subunit n=1 Tax=Lentimicrobium sp. L6 TaxID=2735916 RepID=UPI00155658C3|nr:efflux RND transporter periplasmic adaptor subunit [Lentimicrobium sp. L6]NPD83670.1 efflux RND transporter periplasmic adaptor subunit [Lentimicrobium sp. L6]